MDASTEEELDALELDLVQDGDPFGARDGSGRVVDDVAEEQIAALTEVGPMVDDRGAESVAPGRDDTSSVLRRHRSHPEAVDDSEAILGGDIHPPLDEDLKRMTRRIADKPVPLAFAPIHISMKRCPQALILSPRRCIPSTEENCK